MEIIYDLIELWKEDFGPWTKAFIVALLFLVVLWLLDIIAQIVLILLSGSISEIVGIILGVFGVVVVTFIGIKALKENK